METNNASTNPADRELAAPNAVIDPRTGKEGRP